MPSYSLNFLTPLIFLSKIVTIQRIVLIANRIQSTGARHAPRASDVGRRLGRSAYAEMHHTLVVKALTSLNSYEKNLYVIYMGSVYANCVDTPERIHALIINTLSD